MSLLGCTAIRKHSDDDYVLRQIYAQRPSLRGESLRIQEQQAQWPAGEERTGQPPMRQASYLYAIVRSASDPESHYGIIIVEQRIPQPGARTIVTLRDGFARDFWTRSGKHTRSLQRVILSPKYHKPNPPDLDESGA